MAVGACPPASSWVAMFASMDVGMAMNGAVGVPMNMFVGGRRLRGGGVTVEMVGAVVMGGYEPCRRRGRGGDRGVPGLASRRVSPAPQPHTVAHLLFSYPITRFRFP